MLYVLLFRYLLSGEALRCKTSSTTIHSLRKIRWSGRLSLKDGIFLITFYLLENILWTHGIMEPQGGDTGVNITLTLNLHLTRSCPNILSEMISITCWTYCCFGLKAGFPPIRVKVFRVSIAISIAGKSNKNSKL